MILDMSRLSVLVIDDNVHMRSLFRAILGGFGIRRVHEAADGADGLAMMVDRRPDIAICDWLMEPLNGAEFMTILRRDSDSFISTTPVILVSADARRQVVLEAGPTWRQRVSGQAGFSSHALSTHHPGLAGIGRQKGGRPRRSRAGGASRGGRCCSAVTLRQSHRSPVGALRLARARDKPADMSDPNVPAGASMTSADLSGAGRFRLAVAQLNPVLGDVTAIWTLPGRRARMRPGRGPIWFSFPSCSCPVTRPRIWFSSRPSSRRAERPSRHLPATLPTAGPAC